uniref:Uncharacterized protein n=1 Tax=Rhizophora mucronata TaxID=61149 RepID=A0A2P2NZ59_RHIMU
MRKSKMENIRPLFSPSEFVHLPNRKLTKHK